MMNTKTQIAKIKKLLKEKDFIFVHDLLNEFKNANVYLVGGITRDILLNRKSHDIDFVVANIKINTLKKWLTERGVVNLVGKSFGVLKFTPNNASCKYSAFDIAIPRTEHSWGTGGYKDVETQSDPNLPIEEDLSRRDFTINALAWDIKREKLIDEYDGLTDLKNKIIRTVLKPQDRFKEDYSRMLRALRFACQLEFNIEKNTLTAILNDMSHINDEFENNRIVPNEIIAKELMKSLIADPVKTMDLWDEVNAWKYIMPELLLMKNCPQHNEFHAEGDVWEHTRLALLSLVSPLASEFIKKYFPAFAKKQAEPKSPNNILAALLHDIAKPDTIQTPETHGVDRIRTHEHESVGAKKARAICERLKLSSPDEVGVDINHVEWLIRSHLIAAHGKISEMRPTTIEKYFFKDTLLGTNLLIMLYADGMATLNPEGKPAINALHEIIGKINEILAIFKKKTFAKKLPKPLIDGNEIMKEFDIKSGPQIGELLHIAREAQLSLKIKTKKQAFELLKSEIRD